MKKFFVRLAINAVALYAAVYLLNGHGLLMHDPNPIAFLWLALIFGLVNALLGPIVKFLTCPLVLLTLGLGTLVINGFLFAVAGWVGTQFGVGFVLENFWAAIWGALIVSVVSFILSAFFRDTLKD